MRQFYTESVILYDYTPPTTYWSTGGSYSSAVSIDAAINQTQGNERFFGDGQTVRAEYKLFCDPSTEVYYGRRVKWNGDYYTIVESPKNTLQKDHHYKVLLKAVDGA